MHEILSELKRTYHYVLIDSGPVLAHSEAGVIANQADGILVVAGWQKTSKHDVAGMLALLKTCAAPIVGLVLNRVDITKYKDGAANADFLLPRITLRAAA